MTRGGRRPNAGRKPTLPAEARQRNLKMTDTEYEQVKDLLRKLREGKP